MMNAIAKYNISPKAYEWDVLDLFEAFPKKYFAKGASIYKVGQPAKDILLLVKGKALTYTCCNGPKRKNFANNYFLENNFINLDALDLEAYNNQYAIALTAVEIIAIPRLAFHKILNRNIFLQQSVTQTLLKHSRQNLLRWHRMVQLSSQQRIFYFLIEIMMESGQRMGYEWLIRAPLSMLQIGQLTHTSRQSASTQLNWLKKEGIIHFKGKKYLIIRDLEKLKRIAEYPK